MKNLQAFRGLGIRSISPTIAATVMLDGMVGHPDLFSVCEVSGEGDIVGVRVTNKRIMGKAIKDIHLPEDRLIVMIRGITSPLSPILSQAAGGESRDRNRKTGATQEAVNMMK